MSLYFQRLLASSGMTRPAKNVAAPQEPSFASPAIEEIVEDAVEPAPFISPATAAPTVPAGMAKEMPRSTPEPGGVEISADPAPEAAVATAKVERPFMAWSDKHRLQPEVTSAPLPPPPKDVGARSTPPPAPITREELIQHVFRWVGQNPPNVVPSALDGPVARSVTSEPSAAAGTVPAAEATSATAPRETTAPFSPALPVASLRQPGFGAVEAREASVEISIGTLQIQVEAPPTPKPVRRTTAPRPARGLPAAAQPPAIDINRWRRGFYL